MYHQQVLRFVVCCGVLPAIMAAGACARAEEEAAHVPQVQSEALHETDRPITVTGCLKAGEAANTFVLTAARADSGAETATYQLLISPEVDLRDEVGQQVQVNGTLQARQTATAQTLAVPADTDDDRPTGTAGGQDAPKVQTQTDVEINQLAVASVTPLGEECGIGM